MTPSAKNLSSHETEARASWSFITAPFLLKRPSAPPVLHVDPRAYWLTPTHPSTTSGCDKPYKPIPEEVVTELAHP